MESLNDIEKELLQIWLKQGLGETNRPYDRQGPLNIEVDALWEFAYESVAPVTPGYKRYIKTVEIEEESPSNETDAIIDAFIQKMMKKLGVMERRVVRYIRQTLTLSLNRV